METVLLIYATFKKTEYPFKLACLDNYRLKLQELPISLELFCYFLSATLVITAY